MQLTNIEYGSLASSSVLNNNFIYLDEKITKTGMDLNSSVSAILSNIETINSRLSQLAEEILNLRSNSELTFADLKRKSLSLFNKITMLPNWSNISLVTDLTSFNATTNGYLLLMPKNNASGSININNFEFTLKEIANTNDNSTEMLLIPLKQGDIVSASSVEVTYSYFLPALKIISSEL